MGRRFHHDAQVAATSKFVPNSSASSLSIHADAESKLDGAMPVPCARMAASNRFGNERHLPMARRNQYNLRDLGSGVHLSFFQMGNARVRSQEAGHSGKRFRELCIQIMAVPKETRPRI